MFRHVASGGQGAYALRFWQNRRRRQAAAARRITTCPPRFSDLATCLVAILINEYKGISTVRAPL